MFRKIKIQYFRFDILLYLLIILFSFFSFNHSDLIHTVSHATAILDGHILDFYEFNKINSQLNAVYYPSIYWVYALWALPLKLFGVIDGFTPFSEIGYSFFWFKFLNVIFFVLSCFIFVKSFKVFLPEKKSQFYFVLIWVTSPLAFFSLIIFGQYDIFALFFLMFSIYLLSKNYLIFASIFLGVSLTFKTFGLICFLPLLLLSQKEIWKILLSLILLSLPMYFQKILYSNSLAFNEATGDFNRLMLSKFFALDIVYGDPFSQNLFFILYSFFCVMMYFLSIKNDESRIKVYYYVSFLSCALFFVFIPWHPQWLILITPFIAALIYFNVHLAKLLILDLFFKIVFFIIVVLNFSNNVDIQLFKFGFFENYFYLVESSGLLMKKFVPFKHFPSSFWMSIFTGVLLAFSFVFFPKSGFWVYSQERINDKEFMNNFRFRAICGALVFVLPAFILLFMSLN